MNRKSASDRFMAKVSPEPTTGCWLWTAYAFSYGYGQFHLGNRDMVAHRAAWLLFRGTIPDGMCVLHACDTPLCVNPDHLFLGTKADNTNDMMRKRRHVVRRDFTDGQIRDIRARVAAGERQADVARHYGTTPQRVHNVIRGYIYGHLPLEARDQRVP